VAEGSEGWAEVSGANYTRRIGDVDRTEQHAADAELFEKMAATSRRMSELCNAPDGRRKHELDAERYDELAKFCRERDPFR
jgi:hypothetical protein